MTARTIVIVTFTALTLAGCQREVVHEGPPVVKMRTPERTLVESADAFKNGTLVAYLKTWRFDDGGGKTVTEVLNPRNQRLGFITEDGRAYRATAFEGDKFVSSSSKTGNNVAAILGTPHEKIQIEVLASAR